MLCLSRKAGESIIIAGDVEVKVLDVRGGRVRIGVEAHPDCRIDRKEVHVKREESCP